MLAGLDWVEPTQCGVADGQITLLTPGSPNDYLYSIDGGLSWAVSPTFSQLAAGEYVAVVQLLSNGCRSEPFDTLALTATVGLAFSFVDAITPANCLQSTGEITLMATGGNGAYEYSIDNGLTWQTEGYFPGLSAANYFVLARQQNGDCLMDEALLVDLYPSFAPDIQSVNFESPTDCSLSDGFIAIRVVVSSPHLQFSIDGGQQWSPDRLFDGLGGGIFQVVVWDTLTECRVEYPLPIELESPLQPVIEAITVLQPSSCLPSNGVIDLLMADTSVYYEVSINGGQDWYVATHFTDLLPGTYQVLARNLNTTCLVSYPELINLLPPVTLVLDSLHAQPATTCEATDGQIAVWASGAPDLDYSIDGGLNWVDDPVFGQLPGGVYTVLIRSAAEPDCILQTEPQSLGGALVMAFDGIELTAAQNCIDQGGSIQLNWAGSPGALFSIDGGQNWSEEALFANLQPGDYQLLIANATFSCQATLDSLLTIVGPLPPTVLAINSQPAQNCLANDGAIAVFAAAGGRQQYSIDGGQQWDPDGIFDQLAAGAYALFIRDTLTGCIARHPDSVYIGGIPVLGAEVLLEMPPVCPGDQTGRISLQATGGLAPFRFQWTDETEGRERAQLPAGVYEVIVSDARNCADTLAFELREQVSFEAVADLLADTLLCQGQQVIYDLGGFEPLAVQWTSDDGSFVSDSLRLTIRQPGRYALELITIEGCTFRDTLLVQTTEGAWLADFLMPIAAVAGDPVVLVDITWPVPERIEWVYDPAAATSLASLPTQEVLRFDSPGLYTVGLKAYSGDCFGYLEKPIRIYGDRDSLQLPVQPAAVQAIRSFEVFPNPNAGAFQAKLTLTQPQPAVLWLFRQDGTLLEQRALAGRDLYIEAYNWPGLSPGVYTALAQAGLDWVYINVVVQ